MVTYAVLLALRDALAASIKIQIGIPTETKKMQIVNEIVVPTIIPTRPEE